MNHQQLSFLVGEHPLTKFTSKPQEQTLPQQINPKDFFSKALLKKKIKAKNTINHHQYEKATVCFSLKKKDKLFVKLDALNYPR